MYSRCQTFKAVPCIWLSISTAVSRLSFPPRFMPMGGKASIYDLRSIIENYMEAKQLVHAMCSFRMQVDRIDYTLGEFTLVYCKLQMLRTNCELFLQSHFLTTHAVRLVPHGFQLDLQYIVFPGETGQCATQYVIQREDKDTFD